VTASARHARPRRVAGDGVQAAGEDRLQLLLADLARQARARAAGEPAAHPHAGLLAGTQVVLARADRNAGFW
jgi:hypothetical protein